MNAAEVLLFCGWDKQASAAAAAAASAVSDSAHQPHELSCQQTHCCELQLESKVEDQKFMHAQGSNAYAPGYSLAAWAATLIASTCIGASLCTSLLLLSPAVLAERLCQTMASGSEGVQTAAWQAVP
jgi:hypothetical protein